MGTVIDFTVVAEDVDRILNELSRRIKMYEHRFSANDDSSELMAVNLSAGIKPVKVQPELFQLIALGLENSQASDSLLNIAIGPLIQTWRIGFKEANVPTADTIAEKLKLIDLSQIILNKSAQTVFLKRAGMRLDLGALAKGFIADLLIDYLKEENVDSALLNLGGNVMTLGHSPRQTDGTWHIGIQNPKGARDDLLCQIKVSNQSVVTSGIYERQLTDHGQTYHHIFNPETGYPVETNVASLTIISDKSVDGEIWTTRLFGQPYEKILATVTTLPNIESVVVLKNGQLFYTPALQEKIIFG
ncbi:FAD:protein FMN transferase [Enterococcus timonensis]|uniref:FAD:protein FMN transferase n=1 Tax=Enterococcus timonensis TaxID=1852364 RepID=UPI000D095524|nr:FAD:protein FMN transferase [Enterococcus timonensis]